VRGRRSWERRRLNTLRVNVKPDRHAPRIIQYHAPTSIDHENPPGRASLGSAPRDLPQEFSMPLTQIRSLAVKLAGAAFVVAGPAGAQQIKNAIPDAARPLPLSAVRLTGGPLKQAQDLDADYLLKLEPDRMMAYYRKRAGLEPKAEGYTGWDGDGRNLTGHIAGHYLSAVSFMYAATGDSRFKERADYIVREMKEVQDKHGDGYLGALANGKEQFIEVSKGNIRSASFDLNGLWSPWYVLHKTYAGLRDAYRYTGNRAALEVEIRYAA